MQPKESTLVLGRILRWYFLILMGFTIFSLLTLFTLRLVTSEPLFEHVLSSVGSFVDQDFLAYLVIGFTAQMIDGTLGMAYGVSSSSFLMSIGIAPAVASASVHAAEVITTGFSGFSHWKFGNVAKELFRRLALPGAIGAALGSYVLVAVDGDRIKPYVSAYLFLMGCLILTRAFRKKPVTRRFNRLTPLALFGGFVDASGGGGWGPVVTSTLISSGHSPRFTIGTVSAVEFIVAVTASGVFSAFVGLQNWNVILGLMIGGAVAAPLAAYFCSKVNVRILMTLVGLLIIVVSMRSILQSTGVI